MAARKHAVHNETFSLDEVDVIDERLTLHEHRALSIDLQGPRLVPDLRRMLQDDTHAHVAVKEMTTMTETRTVKLVRLRDGMDAWGRTVEKEGQPQRLGHLVRIDADLDSPDGVRAFCGLEFPAGTLVELPWIESLPHGQCLRRSTWPHRKIEAEYVAANVMPQVSELPAGLEQEARAILDVMPDVIASIAAATRIFENRAGWAQDVSGEPMWEYTESFQGVLIGEKRFPRNHDLGLFALTAEVVKAGVLRVRSCGVLGGCPTHAVHTEYLALDKVDVIEKRLTDLEARARVVGLERLSWCLIVGPCSAHPTHDPVPEVGYGPARSD